MSTLKTTVNDADVKAFLEAVPEAGKRQDSLALLELFGRVTGEQPKMWGPSIVGFGQYHYKSEQSSQEGDWMLTGFSPRKANLSLYLTIDGYEDYDNLMSKLGKHKLGKGCLYINKLADVDMGVLEELVKRTFAAMKQRFS